MTFKDRYLKGKETLLTDETICMENRELFRAFFEYLELSVGKLFDGLAITVIDVRDAVPSPRGLGQSSPCRPVARAVAPGRSAPWARCARGVPV